MQSQQRRPLGVELEHLVDGRLLPDEREAVFVSGSLVAGWQHANSDVDLYVITDAEPASAPAAYSRVRLEPDLVPIVVGFAEGRRFDVEYWQEGQVDQVLAKVESFDLEGEESAGSDLGAEEADFLYRLSVGVALEGEDWLRRRQTALEHSAIRPIFTSLAFNHADGFIEDAVGLLRSGDHETAILCAHRGFQLVVDGLLAHYGELSPSAKWRARKVHAAHPAELAWERYWELETMRGLDLDRPATWVEDVLQECQRIMEAVDIG
ncbi:MAG: hypothetical protein M3540_05560 [Actinomycetota bacterium]|nr:hypothetical protein [Actinomycetota bacterium]